MDTWREATHKSLASTVGVRWGNFPNFNTLPGTVSVGATVSLPDHWSAAP